MMCGCDTKPRCMEGMMAKKVRRGKHMTKTGAWVLPLERILGLANDHRAKSGSRKTGQQKGL